MQSGRCILRLVQAHSRCVWSVQPTKHSRIQECVYPSLPYQNGPVPFILSRFYSATEAESSVSQFHSASSTNLNKLVPEPDTGEDEKEERRGRYGEKDKPSFDLWEVKQKRFARHITNLVRKGKVEEAEQVFQEMLNAKVHPNTVIFNNLISGLSRVGHAHKAFKYFNNLKKRGLSPTNHTYSSLFRAFTEMGSSSRPLLEKVVAEINRKDFLLNTIATNSLMVAMSTCGMIDETFQVYSDMNHRLGQSADVSTFTALLMACSRDRERGMEKVPIVWQEMIACGIVPDIVCFNTLLQCVREAGIPKDMMRNQEQQILIPDINLTNLHTIVGSKSPPSSQQLLPVTKQQSIDGESGPFSVLSKVQIRLHLFPGHKPLAVHVTDDGWRWFDCDNTTTFLCVLTENHLKCSLHTLHHLSHLAVDWATVVKETIVGVASEEKGVVNDERNAVKPDRRCLNAAIRLQTQLGNIKGTEVLHLFGQETGISSGPDQSLLAMRCTSQQEGLELLARMKESGVIPDQRTMGTLLHNATVKLHYEYLIALMKEMRHSKMEPDQYIVKTLEKAVIPPHRQSPRMKLRFNGFKGYYTLWKKHYPQFYDDI